MLKDPRSLLFDLRAYRARFEPYILDTDTDRLYSWDEYTGTYLDAERTAASAIPALTAAFSRKEP